jgi:outer membrane autotransporter protein
LLALLAGTALSVPAPARAQDATWLLNPGSGDFSTGANWTPATVPTGTAFFGASNTTSISNGVAASLGGFTFNAGASAYTITNTADLVFTGAGIVNNSGQTQALVNQHLLQFTNASTAGNAAISNNDVLEFYGTSTAGNATIATNGGATTDFSNSTGPLGDGRLSAGSIAGAGSYILGSNQLTIGGNGASTTVSGVISGVGGALVKTGPGTLTLSGINTYTGGKTIAGGRLSVGDEANLGDVSGGLAFDGGTLAANASFNSGRGITLNAAGGIIDTGNNTLGLSGDITGPGGLTKTGSGELRLTSTGNDYLGPTSVLQGTLAADSDGALSAASDYTIATGATLRVTDNVFFGTVGSLSGAGSIDIRSGATLVTGLNAGTATFSGTIGGPGSLELGGPGTQILTGASNAIGGDLSVCGCAGGQLIVRGGGLSVGGDIQVGLGTLVVDQGGTLTASSSSMLYLFGGGFTVDGAGSSATIGGIYAPVFGVAATLTVSGGAALTSEGVSLDAFLFGSDGSATATVTGAGSNWTINGSGGLSVGLGGDAPAIVSAAAGGTIKADQIAIASNGTLNLGLGAGAGTIDTPFIANDGAIVADFTDTATLSAEISGAGSLTKQGSGTLTLTGNNSYTGTTFLNGGTLSVASDANLGDPASTLALDGGVLRVTGTSFSQSARPITFGASGGGFDIADAANTFTVTQSFAGAGGLSKAGAGTLLLTGAQIYGGATSVTGGTLRAGVAGAFSANSAFTVGAGATLDLGGFNQNIGSLAGAGSVALGSANLSAGANSGSTSFSGVIGGTGTLTKQGTGTLTLTGANTYSGGTTISGGTLVGNTTSLQGPILNDAALVFDQPANGTFAGAISGTGTLTKQGAGGLNLTGASTLSGPTTVSAGLLAVNGSLANSVVTLSGGTLGGNGTVGGINVQTGAVAPGNSIGTLNVAGSVGFAAGTVYQVELNASGASDRIVATGAATLGGGQVQVLAANGTYAQSTRYSILTAQGGVSGRFASATSDLAFLTPVLSYDPNAVVLTMTRNDTDFGPQPDPTPGPTPDGGTPRRFIAETRNQGGVARAAQSLGAGNRVYDTLLGTTAEQARAGFDLLSGEAHAQAVSVAIEDSHLVRETILNRLRAPFGAAAPSGSIQGSFTADLPGRKSVTAMPAPAFDTRRFTVWGEAIGAQGSTDRDGNAASMSRRGGGMLLGAELEQGQWRLGVAGGYTKTDFDLDARRSNGEASSVHGALYGGARLGAVALRAGAAYAWNDADIRRTVSFPGFSDYLRLDGRSATAQAFAEIGYGLTLGRVALEPFAQIAAVTIRTEREAEQGGAAALQVLGRDQNLGFTTLGLRAEMQLGALPLVARGMLGWRYAFGDTTPTADLAFVAGGLPFQSYAAPIARNSLLAEAGLAWKVSNAATLGVSYSAAVSDKARDQALRGRIDITF